MSVAVDSIRVGELATELLLLAKPLSAFSMPLLDAHGATLAEDVTVGDRVYMRSGSRIRSTQIGLAASLGLNNLPTRPQPRVVVLSAGADLVEPGVALRDGDDEYETNSWLLATAVKEAGAVGYRVHSIPRDREALRDIVEDQLVRADLLVICGESHDESFDLIASVVKELGDVREVLPLIEGSGRHAFGLIGPDKTPVVVLPGDPIAAYISHEIFIRPMIRSMLGLTDIHRPVIKARLKNEIAGSEGKHSFIRAILEGDSERESEVRALENQDELVGLSDATGLIVLSESVTQVRAGDLVDVLALERRFT